MRGCPPARSLVQGFLPACVVVASLSYRRVAKSLRRFSAVSITKFPLWVVLPGMAVTRSRLSCPHTPKLVGHCLRVKSLRVEISTDPFQYFFMPSMVGVAHRFDEV